MIVDRPARWPGLLETSLRSFVRHVEDGSLEEARGWGSLALQLRAGPEIADAQTIRALDALEQTLTPAPTNRPPGTKRPPGALERCVTCDTLLDYNDPFVRRSGKVCSRRCRARRWQQRAEQRRSGALNAP